MLEFVLTVPCFNGARACRGYRSYFNALLTAFSTSLKQYHRIVSLLIKGVEKVCGGM